MPLKQIKGTPPEPRARDHITYYGLAIIAYFGGQVRVTLAALSVNMGRRCGISPSSFCDGRGVGCPIILRPILVSCWLHGAMGYPPAGVNFPSLWVHFGTIVGAKLALRALRATLRHSARREGEAALSERNILLIHVRRLKGQRGGGIAAPLPSQKCL